MKLQKIILALISFAAINTAYSSNQLIAGVKDDFRQPLLLIKNEKNPTWTINNSVKLNSPELYFKKGTSIRCAGSLCIYSGEGHNDQIDGVPVTLISHDGGSSWVQAANVSNWPSNFFSAIPNDSNCNNGHCFIVGTSFFEDAEKNTLNVLALLLTSSDAGQTWRYNNVDLPKDAKNSQLMNIQCHDDVCVSIGTYEDKKSYSSFIISTNNNGESWQKGMLNGLPADYKSFTLAHRTLTYSKNTFLCAGSYTTITGSVKAMIFTSSDKGKTWQFNTSPAIADKLNYNIMYMTCDGDSTCMALTSNILRSKDNGMTWENLHVPLSKISPNSELNTIIASTSSWIAVFSKQVGGQHPFILTSFDNGDNWTVTSLPVKYGALSSSLSCLQNDCTLVGIHDNQFRSVLLETLDGGISWQNQPVVDALNKTIELTSASHS